MSRKIERLEMERLMFGQGGMQRFTRNVEQNFVEHITARHYLASDNGPCGNPEVETFRYISRSDDSFTSQIIHSLVAFAVQTAARRLEKFFAVENRNGRKYEAHFHGPVELSIQV